MRGVSSQRHVGFYSLLAQVNVVVTEERMLGLMIRGGNEFGLGIYITGVDAGSVAENAGLKVPLNFCLSVFLCHNKAKSQPFPRISNSLSFCKMHASFLATARKS